jgi:uncharacterized protein
MKTKWLALPRAVRMAALLLTVPVLMSGVRLWAEDSDFATVKSAADKGDAAAQFDLARRFEKGNGVAPDQAKAVEYMQKSADQGYAAAETQLGYYYGEGLGVTENPQEALKWYRKGAEDGNALAQYAMGSFCSTGRGVPKDMDEAIKWWQKAAAQDNVRAEDALGQTYFQKAQTEHTNLAAYTEVAGWLRKAAEHGYIGSMNNLGLLYDQGLGVTRDWKEAARWYREAAEHGNVKAQGNLGTMYLDGRGVTNDMVEAYVWFRLSAMQGGAVGKKYLIDYHDRQLLNADQLAESDRLFSEYRARISAAKQADTTRQ